MTRVSRGTQMFTNVCTCATTARVRSAYTFTPSRMAHNCPLMMTGPRDPLGTARSGQANTRPAMPLTAAAAAGVASRRAMRSQAPRAAPWPGSSTAPGRPARLPPWHEAGRRGSREGQGGLRISRR